MNSTVIDNRAANEAFVRTIVILYYPEARRDLLSAPRQRILRANSDIVHIVGIELALPTAGAIVIVL